MDPNYHYPCPRCSIGLCRTTTLTYVTTIDNVLLSVPDALAYVCDVCSYREFDEEALDHLETLLEASPANGRNAPNTGLERSSQHSKPA